MKLIFIRNLMHKSMTMLKTHFNRKLSTTFNINYVY